MIKSCFIFISYLLLVGCNSSNREQKIIESYDDVDFSVYEGMGAFQRGIDKKGNKLIYVSKTLNSDSFANSGNVIIGIDKNQNVNFIDSSSLNFGFNLDKAQAVALFMDTAEIFGFSASYDGKVYFSTYTFENTNLMRSNEENKNIDGWELIKGKWYKRIN